MSIAVDIVTTVKESGLLEFMLPDIDPGVVVAAPLTHATHLAL